MYFLTKAEPSLATTFASYINKDNIHQIYSGIIKCLLEVKPSLITTFASYITKDNIHQIFQSTIEFLLEADKSTAETIAKTINKDNIHQIKIETIKYFIKSDKSLATTFASYITKDNIHQIGFDIIQCLTKAESSLATIFASYINKDSIHQIGFRIIKCLLEVKPSFATTFASYINKNNIHQISPYTIECLLEADESTAQTIAKTITKDNIHTLDNLTIDCLARADISTAQTIAKSITKDTIEKLELLCIQSLVQATPSLAEQFVSYINPNNIYRIHLFSLDFLAQTSQEAFNSIKRIIQQLPQKKLPNKLIDCFLFDPKKTEKLLKQLNLCIKLNVDYNHLEKEITSFSYQHFITTFIEICNMFTETIQKDPKVRITLFDMLKKELIEHKKGRYNIYHGRKSIRFVRNEIFMYLLELHYQKPIDKNSWYPLHWDQVLSYKEALDTVKPNYIEPTTKERDKMQFFSDLFGCKGGSSALAYTLKNRNAGDDDRGSKTIEELFDIFGWKKYFQVAKKEFEKAEELAKFFKYGTLLQYSFTAQALKEFTFATHESGGIKDGISIDGKKTADTKTVLDTLANHPEKFDKKEKNYEYVMMICDDDKDSKKLGSANPFNQDIRVYSYNMGDDAKIAKQIKELVKLGFLKIKLAMLKDGVIKNPIVNKGDYFGDFNLKSKL